MRLTKLSGSPLKRLFAITLIPIGFIGYPIPLLAQAEERTRIRFISANPDPPGSGTPIADEGTGTRGNCMEKSPPLTRLVGSSNNLALTVNDHPTFWVYVPYTPEEAPAGEFSLQDGKNDVYRTRFQLPATPGIVKISLPPTTKALEIGKTYRWYFDLDCPRKDSSNQQVTSASLPGLVQRVSRPELESQLKAAPTPLERIAVYAKNGIWFETVTELAQLRLNQQQNPTFKNVWVELLGDKTIGLEGIAQQLIVGSVKTSSPPK
jgi:hypothetical protein